MTVAELIALLSTMPQELPVTIRDGRWFYGVPADAGAVNATEGHYIDVRADGEIQRTVGPHVRIG